MSDPTADRLRELAETPDLARFREGVSALAPEARARLRAMLEQARDEPTRENLRTGAPLVERLRTPAALLRRQLRLAKLELLG